MNKFLGYVSALTCAFILGAFSVLLVDVLWEQTGLTNPLAAAPEPAESSRPEPEPPPSSSQPIPQPPAPQPPLTPPRGSNNNLQTSFAEAVIRAAPAVVNVYTTRPSRQQVSNTFSFSFGPFLFEDFFGPPREQNSNPLRSLGSGVVIDREGIIVTNYHVIETAENILVSFLDGRSLEATVIGNDPESDLAVLRVAADDLTPIAFGRYEDVRVGDWVLAIGNPFSVGQTVTQGIISALGRSDVGITTYENFIQTDAAINPGNSGGALINPQGELLGINTAIFSETGGSQGIGFAIPVNTMLDVVEQLTTSGQVRRGWMGLVLRDILPPDQGELAVLSGTAEYSLSVAGVSPDGPAYQAGIQAGDEILSIDGLEFSTTAEIGSYVAQVGPGNTINLEISRNGETLEISLVLATRPSPLVVDPN